MVVGQPGKGEDNGYKNSSGLTGAGFIRRLVSRDVTLELWPALCRNTARWRCLGSLLCRDRYGDGYPLDQITFELISKSMTKVAITGTGLIYRNPKPPIHSIQAYFPSVVVLPDGELLASMVLGEAFEAPNCHTYMVRADCTDHPHEGLANPETMSFVPVAPSRRSHSPGRINNLL